MSDEDLKAIISAYQQKAFELFNTNIVLETQVKSLQTQVKVLSEELDKFKTKNKRTARAEEDFQ